MTGHGARGLAVNMAGYHLSHETVAGVRLEEETARCALGNLLALAAVTRGILPFEFTRGCAVV